MNTQEQLEYERDIAVADAGPAWDGPHRPGHDCPYCPPPAAATAPPANPVTYGWQVYRRLAGVDWPDRDENPAGRDEIRRYSRNLRDALFMHDRLKGAVSEWTLGSYEVKAKDATVQVIAAIRQHCGDGDADYVAKGTRGKAA